MLRSDRLRLVSALPNDLSLNMAAKNSCSVFVYRRRNAAFAYHFRNTLTHEGNSCIINFKMLLLNTGSGCHW